MKERDKLKVCVKCKKLYDKCFCAYPVVEMLNMYDIRKILIENGKISQV